MVFLSATLVFNQTTTNFSNYYCVDVAVILSVEYIGTFLQDESENADLHL